MIIRHRSFYQYNTNNDTPLNAKHFKLDISINRDVYNSLITLAESKSEYVFDWNSFRQAQQLQKLLKKLEITKTTFHGLRGTHASFLF